MVCCLKLLVISHPITSISGGGKRNFETLKYFSSYFDEVTVTLSPHTIKFMIGNYQKNSPQIQEIINNFEMLEKSGIRIDPGSKRFFFDQLTEPEKEGLGKKLNLKLWLFNVFSLFTYEYLISKFLRYYFEAKEFDLIYSQSEALDSVMLSLKIARFKKKPFIVLLQLEPFQNTKNFFRNLDVNNIRDVINSLSYLSPNYAKKIFYKKVQSSKYFRGFLAVSYSPIELSKLGNNPYLILDPGNAFDQILLKFRDLKTEKKYDAIFFARLSEEKGIFDLATIWAKVIKIKPQARLLVYGKGSSYNISKLKNQINQQKMEDQISFCGYEPNHLKLFQKVANSKIFLYPSYSDSFSLGVLESLAVGTPVVAFNIPAIKYNYKDFQAVKIVEKGDFSSMSKEVIKILQTGEDEYFDTINDPHLLRFLMEHSHWNTVVSDEISKIKKLAFYEINP